MNYVYEANIEYSEEDRCWYVDFPDFDGEAYTDGETPEEAARNAAEALTLSICDFLDSGRPLPKATFHNPPRSIISVDVSDDTIAASRCMSVTDAAEELGVTPGRVSQLLSSGQLEVFEYGGTRLVTIASVNARLAEQPKAGRPRKQELIGA